MITPRDEADTAEKPEKPVEIINLKELYEIKYATSATCEEKLHNPKWAICAFCGDCEKTHENVDCIRCKAKAELSERP